MKNFSADLLLTSTSGRHYSLSGLTRLAACLADNGKKNVDDPLRRCKNTINAGDVSANEHKISRNDPGKVTGISSSVEFREKHI